MAIGVDILAVERIARAAETQHFTEKVFTPAELEYFRRGGARPETLAGMYCAKEAAIKALGCGIGKAKLSDVEVRHDPLGRPELAFFGEAARLKGDRVASVSISHDGGMAIAVCQLEEPHRTEETHDLEKTNHTEKTDDLVENHNLKGAHTEEPHKQQEPNKPAEPCKPEKNYRQEETFQSEEIYQQKEPYDIQKTCHGEEK